MKKVLLKYNNLTHLDPYYQHRVMDLGDFYQQLPFDTDFKVYYVTDLDHALMELDPLTDWVVVVAAGHCTQDRNLYDKLIIEALKQNSPLIGHILNFKDQYPHIHPQIFAFDYQRWAAAGWPSWEYSGESETFISQGISASEETFHDEYTPHWIESSGYVHEYSVKEMQVGAQVIREFTEMGWRIVNIPEHIRKNKFHLYPDQQWESFNEFLHGGEYTGTVYEQKNYAQLIGHLDNQVLDQYYVFNTEPLARPDVTTGIDHYAGVASGLKLVSTMIKNGYSKQTIVTHIDFSNAALEFQEFLWSEWDGDLTNYQNVCLDFQKRHLHAYPCYPRGTWEENTQYLLNNIGITAEEFKEHWYAYRQLSVSFKKINLYNVAEQFELAKLCSKYDTNYVWVSNAFWMEYSLIRFGKDRLKESRDNFIRELEDSDKRIILDIEDTWHQGLIRFNH